MRIDGVLRPQGRVFYGWWIVAAAGGIQYLASLLLMQSYGAYAVLLEDEFGWSKTVLAGAFAMTRVESGILGPLQGWLADRFGPRMILRVGTVLFGAGFLMFSQVTTLVGFYVTFLIIALGASLGGFATLMVSLVNWFDRHRSKAVAISQTGFALGGFSVPLVVLLLQNYGWRPLAGNQVQTRRLEAMVARVAKYLRQVQSGTGVLEHGNANRPEGEHHGEAGVGIP
jgi:OFA family oxalate/formate antiporter-like MFS transporter